MSLRVIVSPRSFVRVIRAKPRQFAVSSKFIKLAEKFSCFANETATVIKKKYFDFNEVNERWKVRYAYESVFGFSTL